MRFLIDECLSTLVVDLLRAEGHDAVHVGERDLLGHRDEDVLTCAVTEDRVLVSADTDFGELLARSGDAVPSIVLFRRVGRLPRDRVATLVANLPALADDLAAGAIVVLTDDRIRIRPLPVTGSG